MPSKKRLRLTISAIAWIAFSMLTSAADAADRPVPLRESDPKPTASDKVAATGQALFDGKSLKGWKITRFGGEGEVTVDRGRILLGMGSPLTGITYEKKFPKSNYEISLKAMRQDGIDFFCAVTFPVQDSHATFVVGGWAGAVVGISCIDGNDASANSTTRYESFEDDRWYQIRVRVSDQRLQAWIDDQRMVDVDVTKHRFSTRVEVDLSKPMGIACYQTWAALRDIRVRRLSAAAKKDPSTATERIENSVPK